MKPFLAFLSEAVAVKPKTAKPRRARKPSKAPVIPQTDTEPFKAKFDRLVSGTGIQNPWHLTGHGKGFDPSGEIERMKIAVFGKRTGSTQLGWYLRNGGLVIVDATGNASHSAVEANPWDYGIPDEVTDKLEYFNIVAWLRIEHHEGGGGVIGVAFRAGDDKAVIRSLRRKYPKHVIHDGHGNEFMESHEAIHTSTEKQMKTFSEFWDGVAGLRNRQRLDEGLDASLIVGADNERERVWDANTTHNHGVIAKAVDPKLYHILWHTSGTVKAKELIPILKLALQKMSTHAGRARYKKFDHKSGWGNVEHFSEFCADLLRACEKHPEARYEGNS